MAQQILGAGGEEWRTFEQQAGYDPNAWTATLEQARGRIEGLRTREARIRLTDRAGRPLANRPVEVVQTDSAFRWGFCGWGYLNAIQDGRWAKDEHLHARMSDLALYNAINLMHYWAERHCDNAPQSEEYQGHVGYEHLERAVEWARGNRLHAKGHPIYWPVGKAIPAWVLKYDVPTRRKFLEVRVRQLVARFRGRIEYYDAVNEMMWEPTLANTERRHWPHVEPLEAIADEAADVLRWAREEDPDACYTLNEYGLVRGETEPITVPCSDGSTMTRDRQLDRFIAMSRLLVRRGQAPDALGLQSLPEDWRHLDRVAATLDAIGEGTGLPVHISEFRTGIAHLEKAGLPKQECRTRLADYIEAVITTCFGNPHCDAFWFWGAPEFMDGRRPTIVYQRVRELIRERWMTTLSLRTDGDGRIAFRGFCGSYSLRLARSSGQPSGYAFELPTSASGPVGAEIRTGLVE